MPFRIRYVFGHNYGLHIIKCILAKPDQGFTIIEIIFSVAISGILAASVITTVFGHAQAIEAENSHNIKGKLQSAETASNNVSTSLIALDLNITDSEAWQKQIQSTSAQTELKIVQTAMDIMMINSNTKSISPTSATNDMSSFPIGNPLYPRLLREQYSKYTYKCNSNGEVTRIDEEGFGEINSNTTYDK